MDQAGERSGLFNLTWAELERCFDETIVAGRCAFKSERDTYQGGMYHCPICFTMVVSGYAHEPCELMQEEAARRLARGYGGDNLPEVSATQND
jgi:hypothetical protein